MKIIWVGRACACNLKYQIFSICIWALGRKLTLCESTRHWLPVQNSWLLNYSTGLSDIIQLVACTCDNNDNDDDDDNNNIIQWGWASESRGL